MSSQPKFAGQAFFDRIPATTNDEAAKCEALYDDWAQTYDQDLTDASHGYVGPAEAAKVIAQNSTKNGQVILDAGCGTGLSGLAIKSAVGPDTIIDGIDISNGMLEVAAKKGIYRKLEPADLSKPLAIPDNVYDGVVCVGTLTGGHVGPVPALSEFTRVVKSGGLVVATVREDVWTSGGYEAEAHRLENIGSVAVLNTDSVPYRQAQGVNAKLLVMRKSQ
jgi:predicted TPR repeat methyltransferase